jgi:hypothetical protein
MLACGRNGKIGWKKSTEKSNLAIYRAKMARSGRRGAATSRTTPKTTPFWRDRGEGKQFTGCTRMLTRALLDSVAECQPPATLEDIQAAQAEFPVALPGEYLELLASSNGLVGKASPNVTVYCLADLPERNLTYEVHQYAPSLLLIGDDGGGRGIFLSSLPSERKDVPVVMVGLGAIGIDRPCLLAPSIEVWAKEGFPVPE